MGSVFVSYRRGDSESEARALVESLRRRLGEGSVFIDVDDIALGRDFRHVLNDRLARCDLFLALIGPNWLDSTDASGIRRLDEPLDYVRQEVATALKRDIPVTPVLLRGASSPSDRQSPDDIKDLAFRNSFELRHAKWDADVSEMLRLLGRTQPYTRRWFAMAASVALVVLGLFLYSRTSNPVSSNTNANESSSATTPDTFLNFEFDRPPGWTRHEQVQNGTGRQILYLVPPGVSPPRESAEVETVAIVITAADKGLVAADPSLYQQYFPAYERFLLSFRRKELR